MFYPRFYSLLRTPSRLDLFGLRSKITFFYCDLLNYRGLLDIIAGEGIDTIFHLAASAIVGVAVRIPLAALESNVMGTANVLEASRESGIERTEEK